MLDLLQPLSFQLHLTRELLWLWLLWLLLRALCRGKAQCRHFLVRCIPILTLLLLLLHLILMQQVMACRPVRRWLLLRKLCML